MYYTLAGLSRKMTMKSNSTTTRTVKVVTETTDQTGRSTGSMVYLVMPLLMIALRRRAMLFIAT